MKLAVVTLNLNNKLDDIANYTIPYMKRYADRIEADFICIDKLTLKYEPVDKFRFKNEVSPPPDHWAKYQIYDILNEYDRLLYVDIDALILPHCPNIFNFVPREFFAALYENEYGISHAIEILDYQKRCLDIGWKDEYFNTGVMVVSKEHREVFKFNDTIIEGRSYPEQTSLNYRIQKLKLKTFSLESKFNHMWFLDSAEYKDGQRFKNYIVHYADFPHRHKRAIIKHDLARLGNNEAPQTYQEMKKLQRAVDRGLHSTNWISIIQK